MRLVLLAALTCQLSPTADAVEQLQAQCAKIEAAAEVQLAEADATVAFGDLLESQKGKVVIVDFWASWCAPCMATLKLYNEWQQELGDDVAIIAVNIGEDTGTIDAVKQRLGGLEHVRIVQDQWSETYDALEMGGLPYALVFDRDGKLVRDKRGGKHDGSLRELIDSLR